MSGFWKRAGFTVGAWTLGATCLALWAGRARAEERLAPAIGDGACMRAARLDEPVRDTRAMAAPGGARFRVAAFEDDGVLPPGRPAGRGRTPCTPDRR